MTRDELIELLRLRRNNDVVVQMTVDDDIVETGNPALYFTHTVSILSVSYDEDRDRIVIVTDDAYGPSWGES